MTQIESIKQNIHYEKIQLIKALNMVCVNEIENEQKRASVKHHIEELKQLNFSLKAAINQLS